MNALFFQLPDALAESPHLLAFEGKGRQIDNGVIADLQFLKACLAVKRQQVGERLMPRDGPAVFFAKLFELTNRSGEALRRTDRIAQCDRHIRADAVGDEAVVHRIEEIGFVRPKFEIIQRCAPVLFKQFLRAFLLLRQGMKAIENRAKERKQSIPDDGDRQSVERIEKPRGITRMRRERRVADERQEQQRSVNRIKQVEVNPEFAQFEQPEPRHTVAERRQHSDRETQPRRAPVHYTTLDRETAPRVMQRGNERQWEDHLPAMMASEEMKQG